MKNLQTIIQEKLRLGKTTQIDDSDKYCSSIKELSVKYNFKYDKVVKDYYEYDITLSDILITIIKNRYNYRDIEKYEKFRNAVEYFSKNELHIPEIDISASSNIARLYIFDSTRSKSVAEFEIDYRDNSLQFSVNKNKPEMESYIAKLFDFILEYEEN